MSTARQEVIELVERRLRENPALTSAELQREALEIDKSVKVLSPRQFHATYALQARRRLFGRAGRGRKRNARATSIEELLGAVFADKKASFDTAASDAFRRAVKADSIEQVNRLIATIDDAVESVKRTT